MKTEHLKTFYCICSTLIMCALAWQNHQIKNQPSTFPVDFEDVRQVDIEDAVVEGIHTAPITLVAFSDFTCPPCADTAKTLDKVKRRFGNKIKIVYKHTGKSETGLDAHRAVLAAAKQDAHWPMLQQLYANQQHLADPLYVSLAAQMGLDEEQFLLDFISNYAETQRAANNQQAKALGVDGTPTLFINGVRLEVNAYAAIKEAIEYLYIN